MKCLPASSVRDFTNNFIKIYSSNFFSQETFRNIDLKETFQWLNLPCYMVMHTQGGFFPLYHFTVERKKNIQKIIKNKENLFECA